jgi:hypothetical protein
MLEKVLLLGKLAYLAVAIAVVVAVTVVWTVIRRPE